MKSAVLFLVNPHREAGRSYMQALKAFPGIEVKAIWNSEFHYRTWAHSTPPGIDQHILLPENGELDVWLSAIKDFEPLGFVATDDIGAPAADKLQAHFFPNRCNDRSLQSVRSDKLSYSEHLRAQGLIETTQFKVSSLRSLPIDPPFILKPLRGSGNDGIYFVRSHDVLKSIEAKVSAREYMLQEFVDGREFCVEICSDADQHTCTTIMEYGRMYLVNEVSPWRYDNDLIDPSGHEQLVQYAVKIVRALGVRLGVSWLQIRYVKDRPTLIECNFRSQGHAHYIALKEASGLNFADLVLKQHLESTNRQPEYEHLISYKKIGDFKKLAINNRVAKRVNELDMNTIRNLPSTKAAYFNPHVVPGFAEQTTGFQNTLGMVLLGNCDRAQFLKDFDYVSQWQKKVEW